MGRAVMYRCAALVLLRLDQAALSKSPQAQLLLEHLVLCLWAPDHRCVVQAAMLSSLLERPEAAKVVR
jgi:hypothetical protein